MPREELGGRSDACLTAQDRFDTRKHQFELCPRQLADTFEQQFSIYCDDLRCIRHRIFREACYVGRKQRIARHVRPPKICAKGNTNDGRNVATVKRVALDYDDRTPKARARADWRRKIGPPHFALGYDHSVFSRTRRAAALTNSSL